MDVAVNCRDNKRAAGRSAVSVIARRHSDFYFFKSTFRCFCRHKKLRQINFLLFEIRTDDIQCRDNFRLDDLQRFLLREHRFRKRTCLLFQSADDRLLQFRRRAFTGTLGRRCFCGRCRACCRRRRRSRKILGIRNVIHAVFIHVMKRTEGMVHIHHLLRIRVHDRRRKAILQADCEECRGDDISARKSKRNIGDTERGIYFQIMTYTVDRLHGGKGRCRIG